MGRTPYLQDLAIDWKVVCIPFQYGTLQHSSSLQDPCIQGALNNGDTT